MADAIAICGATATGKTAVAIAAALRLDGEIISMDSRQVYRGMDIGTAKPSTAERAGVPHHGFDLVDPKERFNAGRFASFARSCIASIRARRRTPILAGGTGFFLRALTHPLFEEPAFEPQRKEACKRYLATLSGERLAAWAAALDPEAAARTTDRQRLARVVEIGLLSGRPLSWWHRHAAPAAAAIDPMVFVLELPREELYRRINERVAAMVEAGLVDEVRDLLAAGHDERDPGLNATGYIELVPYVRGEVTLAEAVDAVKRATRRYARRQITWLRHQLPGDARRLDARLPAAHLAEMIAGAWREENA